jgi:hypothetical protein
MAILASVSMLGALSPHPTLPTAWVATVKEAEVGVVYESYIMVDKPTATNPSAKWTNFTDGSCQRLIFDGPEGAAKRCAPRRTNEPSQPSRTSVRLQEQHACADMRQTSLGARLSTAARRRRLGTMSSIRSRMCTLHCWRL